MGVLVLAGVVVAMVIIGLVLHTLSRTVADILDWLLPLMYGLVLVLGIAMVLGRNPFARLATTQVPILRSSAATAFVYGMLMAPLTLPCTGPLVISAFVIGGVSGGGALWDSLRYFLWFALGFGWPLVVLPLLAAPKQQAITRFLARHHRPVTVVSGVLLVGIAVFGWWTDVRPSA
jgi:cytochrome c-type biogenesis protein